jgi:hypothetical protein
MMTPEQQEAFTAMVDQAMFHNRRLTRTKAEAAVTATIHSGQVRWNDRGHYCPGRDCLRCLLDLSACSAR